MNVHIWKGLVFRYCGNTLSACCMLTVRYRGFRLIDIHIYIYMYLCGRFESVSFQCSAKNNFIREIEFYVGDAKWKPIRIEVRESKSIAVVTSMTSSVACQTKIGANRWEMLKVARVRTLWLMIVQSFCYCTEGVSESSATRAFGLHYNQSTNWHQLKCNVKKIHTLSDWLLWRHVFSSSNYISSAN